MKRSEVKKKEEFFGRRLVELVFSWTLKDVLNKDLHEGKVDKIPENFPSTDKYLKSFINPLVEETHYDLYSSMSTTSRPLVGEVSSVTISKHFRLPKDLFYNFIMMPKTYRPEVGDLVALTDTFPRSIEDLKRPYKPYLIAYVQASEATEDEDDLNSITLFSPKAIEFRDRRVNDKFSICRASEVRQFFVVYLMNMTTNIRIYSALRSELEGSNMNVIKQILQPNTTGENCDACNFKVNHSDEYSHIRSLVKASNSNSSQESAILNGICLRVCTDQNSVNLIWGPPGTGKTKTIGQLLFCLLKMKCRTLTCAPTNIAVTTVTERLFHNVLESLDYDTYGLGDIILFGNSKRMKMDEHRDLLDVFLDHRALMLSKCLFSPKSGYRHKLEKLIGLLKDPQGMYQLYLKKHEDNKEHGEGDDDQDRSEKKSRIPPQTLSKFVLRRFNHICKSLVFCMESLYTHLPTSFISVDVVKKMFSATICLSSLETLLVRVVDSDEKLKQTFNGLSYEGNNRDFHFFKLINTRIKCIDLLESLPRSFGVPSFMDSYEIKSFCLSNACLIFCTASSSVKLHREGMAAVELVVVDEAAQLKECESAIALQISGLRHAILIGDDKQLSPMVRSQISKEAGFGRSLFQRLAQLGHKKDLLNVQYRMHPSISLFPNREFYKMQISDAPAVQSSLYKKQYLQGNMFGPFSFINIAHGKERYDESSSAKNTAEVAVVAEILARLSEESNRTGRKISIGVISPYNAQVYAIQEKIGDSYDPKSNRSISVSVRSVDGFQGSEEDVIIISTVRSNWKGNVGFLSCHQRTNVALTRAKHCLWVLGSGATLKKSGSIWERVVAYAEEEGFFYEADEDDRLAKAISDSLIQFNHFDTLLGVDSPLFRKSIWKVCFHSEFRSSMEKTNNVEIRMKVFSLLEKLSSGWRHPYRDVTSSASLVEQYKVNNMLSLIWSVDIHKEGSHYIQVMKVWDVLSLEAIPKLGQRLEIVFQSYAATKMNRCIEKSGEGNLVVPLKWHEDLLDSDAVELLPKPFASLSLKDRSEEPSSSQRNHHNYNMRGRGRANGYRRKQTWLPKE